MYILQQNLTQKKLFSTVLLPNDNKYEKVSAGALCTKFVDCRLTTF